MKSPLRYPGGKTRACKILDQIIVNNNIKIDTIISPFFGGCSFEFYLENKYKIKIIANDKFNPLYIFWKTVKENKEELCNQLYEKLNKIDKEIFMKMRKEIIKSEGIDKALMYFIINRCSFSGSTLSGGFSLESSKNRFTESSIDRINKLDLSNIEIYNQDFKEFINNNKKGFMFLDPPYYLEKKSKLYGNNGDMHEDFNHNELYNCLKDRKNWIMTYNNCEFIKKLYNKFKIIETSWSYSMNKTKESSEIVILSKN